MKAGKLVALVVIGGGGYMAYRKGWLSGLLGKITAGASAGLAAVTPSAYQPGAEAPNQWEALLRANWAQVQPWARANIDWAAAIMRQESGNQGSGARGAAGEIGLFQVKPGTAAFLYSKGYREFQATSDVLATDAGGVYFGTANLQYLSTLHNDRAWVAKGHNGGPGWEGLGDSYKAARETYYRAVLALWSEMYGKGEVT